MDVSKHSNKNEPVRRQLDTFINVPNVDMIPQASHAMSVRPTEPAPSVTPTGEINIPEPKNITVLHIIYFLNLHSCKNYRTRPTPVSCP